MPPRAERGTGQEVVSPTGPTRHRVDRVPRVTNDEATASRAKLTCGQRAPGQRRPEDSRRHRQSYREPRPQQPPFTSVGGRSMTARRVNLALQRTRPRPALSLESSLIGPWPGPLSFVVKGHKGVRNEWHSDCKPSPNPFSWVNCPIDRTIGFGYKRCSHARHACRPTSGHRAD